MDAQTKNKFMAASCLMIIMILVLILTYEIDNQSEDMTQNNPLSGKTIIIPKKSDLLRKTSNKQDTEEFATEKEKSTKLREWFDKNPSPTFTNYKKKFGEDSDIVEYESLRLGLTQSGRI